MRSTPPSGTRAGASGNATLAATRGQHSAGGGRRPDQSVRAPSATDDLPACQLSCAGSVARQTLKACDTCDAPVPPMTDDSERIQTSANGFRIHLSRSDALPDATSSVMRVYLRTYTQHVHPKLWESGSFMTLRRRPWAPFRHKLPLRPSRREVQFSWHPVARGVWRASGHPNQEETRKLPWLSARRAGPGSLR